MDEKALLSLTSGVYILGSLDDDRPVGSAIDTAIQVALKPLSVSISCINTSFTKECIEKTGLFTVSILGKQVNPFVIANFGFQTSRNVNKWDTVEHDYIDNLPYLRDCIAVIKCEVTGKVEFESHTLFTAKVVEAIHIKDEEALTYGFYRSSFKNEVFKFLPQIMKNKEKNNG